MEGIVKLTEEGLTTFAGFVFELDSARVWQADSSYGQKARCFRTVGELIADFEENAGRDQVFMCYVIHYPKSGGFISKEKIAHDPTSREGHTFRYVIEGWGLIQFQIDMRTKPLLECRVAVNSEARARLWHPQLPKLKDPSLWNWPLVQKRAGQLIRRMKKIARHDGIGGR